MSLTKVGGPSVQVGLNGKQSEPIIDLMLKGLLDDKLDSIDKNATKFLFNQFKGDDNILTIKELAQGIEKLETINEDGGFDKALKDGHLSTKELEDIFKEYKNMNKTEDKDKDKDKDKEKAENKEKDKEKECKKENSDSKKFFSKIFNDHFKEEVKLTDSAVKALEKQYGGKNSKLDKDEKERATRDLNKRMDKGEFDSAVEDGGSDIVTGYDVKDVYEKK
jgi:hypothetical protein